jgi:hypothetical protein
LDSLAMALDRGFHDFSYQEHNRMPYDPALIAIRGHPRFAELVPRPDGL